MSLLSIVASSSAFLLPSSPPPKGSSIDSDWSIKNTKQPGFLRLISAWYGMVSSTFRVMISLFDHDLARLVFTKENHRRSSRQKHAGIETISVPGSCNAGRWPPAEAFVPSARARVLLAV